MQPMTHAAEQLRVLCSLANPTNKRTASIIWRPRYVVVADEGAMLVVPLPADHDRNMAILGADIVGWLAGLAPKPDVDGYGDPLDTPPLAVRIKRTGDAVHLSTPSICTSYLVAPLDKRGHSEVFAIVEKMVTDRRTEIAGHMVSPRYLAAMTRVVDAFGAPEKTGVRLLRCAGARSPITYGIATEHGTALFVVMPMLDVAGPVMP